MKNALSLTRAHHEYPLWQGHNAWNPWPSSPGPDGQHLYAGHNAWLPWGGVDSVADMDEYRADKAVDIKATIVVIATLVLMLLHYLLSK